MNNTPFITSEWKRNLGYSLIIILILFSCSFNSLGQERSVETTNNNPKTFLARRELVPFHSKIMNLVLEIQIGFPVSYFTNDKLFEIVITRT